MTDEYTVKYNNVYMIMTYYSPDSIYSFNGQDLIRALDLKPKDPLYNAIGKTITDKEIYSLLKDFPSPEIQVFFNWFITEILIQKTHILLDIYIYIDSLRVKLDILPTGTQEKKGTILVLKAVKKSEILSELKQLLCQIPLIVTNFKSELEGCITAQIQSI